MSSSLHAWRPRRLLALPFAAAALAATARSQCATQWLPGPALGGCAFGVSAILEWDPDGPGPRSPIAVFGGAFATAGNVPANRIAGFDPATNAWSTFGSGMNGKVNALAVLPNGDLVAAGEFTTAGGSPANRIARWDGVAWSPLGAGVDEPVRALCVLPTGELVAGGLFDAAGGAPAHRIARWNGVAWSPLGGGPGTTGGDVVVALTVRPGGELLAGGSFTQTGSPQPYPLASWNGTAWSPVPGISGLLRALTTEPNGDVLAGGGLTAGGVLRWNGSVWTPVGGASSPTALAMCRLANGDIVVSAGSYVMRWDGSVWSSIGTLSLSIEVAAQLGNGTLLVGGNLYQVNGVPVIGVAAWNGAVWSQPGPATESPTSVYAATELPNGDIVIAAGVWSATGPGPGTARVLRWNGSAWAQLGPSFNGPVLSLATAQNGDVVAGGGFTQAGGASVPAVVRWNGSSWQALGSGIGTTVTSLLVLPGGDMLAGGSFNLAGGSVANNVARWNGTAWAPVGGGLVGSVEVLAVAANGDILAGGSSYPSGLRRWDGTAWTSIGDLGGTTYALAELGNGDVVASGANLFSAGGGMLNGIGRWNGTAWLPFGAGMASGIASVVEVNGLTVLPDGDLVACGRFGIAGGVVAHGAARWNGTAWAPLATTGSGAGGNGFPTSLTRAMNGDVIVTGSYRMDDSVSVGFARLTTTCPATVGLSASGCAGNVLGATSLPWTGSTFRALASGLPATSIALDVLGASTVSVPLPLLLPQGVAGCSLAVTPDAVGALLPSGGTVSTQLPIPNTAALAGIVLHEQVLALGLGAGGAITTFTGTNRLTLTIGAF